MITAEMFFTEAKEAWLATCTLTPAAAVAGRYIKETTETSYRQYCESLALFFGDMPLGKIHCGNLREFQRARLSGAEPFVRYRRPQDAKPRVVKGTTLPPKGKAPCPAKPKKVNQELAVLRRIMIQGSAWTPELETQYRPLLEEESEQQRALEPDEQELWLKTAASRERWQVVYWYTLLAIGCTLSTNELRYLRVGDVNLLHRTITITGKGVKCRGRRRVIALLTAEEMWAAEKLLERAKTECGCKDPQDYVLPFRNRKYAWNPKKPMSTSGIKREWQEVREASELRWFRQYDCRHTGGTNLALLGWRPAQIKARMGHITDQMNEHYTHISEAAQHREHSRVAFERMGPRPERPGWFDRRVAYQ